jgi:hypothetical protein
MAHCLRRVAMDAKLGPRGADSIRSKAVGDAHALGRPSTVVQLAFSLATIVPDDVGSCVAGGGVFAGASLTQYLCVIIMPRA